MFPFIIAALLFVTELSQQQQQQQASTTFDDSSLFCTDCPKQCFVWCVRASNATSPCDDARKQRSFAKDEQCLQMRCVNFYCGTPAAIYCSPQGKIARQCLPQGSPFEGVPETSKCWEYFESQCQNNGIVRPIDTEVATTEPPPPPPIITPAPARPTCSGCPDECGDLCTLTQATKAPCLLYRQSLDGASPDDQNFNKTCASRCRNSYCSSPHTYFCDESGRFDMECTKDEAALAFLNSTSDVCRNWYIGQCPRSRVTTPGQPKPRPTTPSGNTEPAPVEIGAQSYLAPEPGPKRLMAKCNPGCPDECGQLCQQTYAVRAPCFRGNQEPNDNSKCPSQNCRDSYCGVPHAYFCTKNGQFDFECSTEAKTLQFLNSSEVCRKWYMGQCIGLNSRPLVPGVTKIRPTTTTAPPQLLLGPGDEQEVKPERCEPTCPEACGDLCTKINYEAEMLSPCNEVRVAEPTCADMRCRNLYCSNPLALFCEDDGQIQWNCTAKSANAVNFLSTANDECQNWFMTLCSTRRPKVTVPPLVPEPYPDETDEQRQQRQEPPSRRRPVELCANDCPSQCGELCNIVNSFAAPCSVVDNKGGACPTARCHDFYCSVPFALFCTENGTIDTDCTEQAAFSTFINSTIEECRLWIAAQCGGKTVGEPTTVLHQEQRRSHEKREITTNNPKLATTTTTKPVEDAFRICQNDCPVAACGKALCKLTESIREPCRSNAVYNAATECPLESCRNLYCGAPLPFYCFADGTMDMGCTEQNDMATRFLYSNSSTCSQWFFNQCKVARAKLTSPRPNSDNSRPTRPFFRTTPTTTTTTTTTTEAVPEESGSGDYDGSTDGL